MFNKNVDLLYTGRDGGYCLTGNYKKIKLRERAGNENNLYESLSLKLEGYLKGFHGTK